MTDAHTIKPKVQAGAVDPSIAGKPLEFRPPTKITMPSGRVTILPGTLPRQGYREPGMSAIDEQRQELQDLPFWDQTVASERWFAENMPKVMGAVSSAWDSTPEQFRMAASAVGKPIITAVGPILGVLGVAVDILAEGTERGIGLADQLIKANLAGDGITTEKLNRMWKAGGLYYDTMRGTQINLDETTGFASGVIIQDDDSHDQRMARVRDLIDQGMSNEDIINILHNELGALAVGSQLTDLLGHIVLDPINIVMPMIKPIERLKSIRNVLRLQVSEPHLVTKLDDLAKTADDLGKVVDDLYDARHLADDVATWADDIASKTDEIQKIELQIQATRDALLEAQGAALKPWEKKAVDLLGARPGEGIDKEIAFMRRFGGVPLGMEGGHIRPVKWYKPWTWFQLTPQAKISELVNTMGDTLGLYMKNAQDLPSLEKAIAAVVEGAISPRQYGNLFLTREGRTLQAFVQAGGGEAQKILDAYKVSNFPLRNSLDEVAEVLGRTQDDVLSLLDKHGPAHVWDEIAKGMPPVDAKDLTNAQKSLFAKMADGTFSKKTVDRFAKTFLGDNAAPFNLDSLKLHMIGRFAEVSANQAMLQLGLDAQGVWTKAVNALKAAETLAYLRINPGYPIRNFLNNELTMWARGVWGTMSTDDIMKYWGRVGMQPTSLGAGFGPAEMAAETAAGSIQDAVSGAMQAMKRAQIGEVGWLDKLAGNISDFRPLGKLDTGAWASQLEAWASRRAYTKGFQRAYTGSWKPGGRFGFENVEEFFAKEVPDFDIQALGGDFSNVLHKHIQGAVNAGEVDDLFFVNLRANMPNVIDGAAKRMGVDPKKFYEVLGDDMIDAIGKSVADALERGDVDALNSVFETAYKASQRHLDNLTEETVAIMADRAAARIVAEGSPTAYLRLWDEMSAEMYGGWDGYLKALPERVDIIRAIDDKAARQSAWDQFFVENNAYWARTHKRLQANVDGMLIATERYGVPIGDDAIKPLTNFIDDTKKFHSDKTSIFKRFRDGDYATSAERELAWQRAQGEISTLYDDMINKTYQNGMDLDESLLAVIKHSQPERVPAMSAWRDTVHTLRKRYMERVRTFYKELEGVTDEAERAARHLEFGNERALWQNRIHMSEREGIESMTTGLPFGSYRELDDMTMDLYNGMASKYGDNIVLTQISDEPPDQWIRRIGDQMGFGDNPSDDQLRMIDRIRAKEIEEAYNPPMATALEEAWAPFGGKAGREGYENGVNLANQKLAKLERDGVSLSDGIKEAEKLITDDATKIAWQAEANALARGVEEGRHVGTHIVFKNSEKTASRIAKARAVSLDGPSKVAGSTHSAVSGQAMTRVDGFSVGLFPSRVRQIEGELTEEVMAQYIRANADLLSDGRAVIETWTDAKGVTHLDVRAVTPNVEDALRMGRSQAQEEVWDLGRMEGIKVVKEDPLQGARLLAVEEQRVAREAYDAIVENTLEARDAVLKNAKYHKDLDFVEESERLGRVIIDGEERSLRLIGKGASKRVYDLQDGTVLKVTVKKPITPAAQARGTDIYREFSSSLDEAAIFLKYEDSGRFPKVIGSGQNELYEWTVVERVTPFPEGRGLDQFVSPHITEDIEEAIGEGVADLMLDQNWGLNSRGRIVLLDSSDWKSIQAGSDELGTMLLAEEALLSNPVHMAGFVNGKNWLPFAAKNSDPEKALRLLDEKIIAKRTGLKPSAFVEFPSHVDAPLPARVAVDLADADEMTSLYIVRQRLIEMLEGPVDLTDEMRILDELPYREFDMIQLERYAPIDDLKVIDPLDAAQRTGVPAEEARRLANYGDDFVPRMDYYAKGATPEADVVARAKNRYFTEVAEDRIYDMRADPDGLRVFTDPKAPPEMQVVDITLTEKAVRDAGYAGITDGQRYAIFEELPVKDARFLGPNDSPRVLFQKASQFKEDASKAAKAIPGITDEHVDGFMLLLQARAEQWAADTGRSADEWWSLNMAGLRIGGEAGLEQVGEGVIKGSTEFLADGRALIRAYNQADFSTLVHESAHIFRRELSQDQFGVVDDWLRTIANKKGAFKGKVGKALVKDAEGNITGLTVEGEEAFARAFERWLRVGNAPTPALEEIFTKFKNWLHRVYKTIKRSDIDVPINKEMDDLFAAMFKGDPPTSAGSGLPSTLVDQLVPDSPNMARGMDEMWWGDGRNMFNAMKESALDEVAKPALKMDDVMAGMAPDAAKRFEGGIRQYATKIKGQMNDAQNYAMKQAEMFRDSALLNYSRRTHFDMGMANMFPFSFWTTHSMYNWALWSIDRPMVLSTFVKMKKYLGNSGMQNAPTRLRDSVPVPFGSLPFIPDWMGPLYVNPLRIGWPFDMWANPVENAYYSGTRINDRAQRIIEERLREDDITQDEYNEALSRQGDAWTAAINEARASVDNDSGVEMISRLVAPHAPLMWAYHLARGTTDEIGPFLPATRTIKGVSSLLGAPGAGINPEGWIRGKLGLPEFDNWDEYRTDRMLASQAAVGEISLQTAMQSMETRAGEPFQIAQERAGDEAGVRALFGALGIPVMIYPLGERESRGLTEMMYEAYELQNQGDTQAVNSFFEAHPEVKARLALFDTPEERTRTFAVDALWSKWNTLTSLEKSAVTDSLGEDFGTWFLNKDTQSVESIPIDTLQVWLKLMNGEPAGTMSIGAKPIDFPPKGIAQQAEAFYRTRASRYGDQIWELQADYHKLEKGAARREYLQKFPILKDYWGWRRQWLKDHPNVAPYLVEDPEDLPLYGSVRELEEAVAGQTTYSWPEWQRIMNQDKELVRLLMDSFIFEDRQLGDIEYQALSAYAESLGMSPDALLESMESSFGAFVGGQ